MADRPMSELPVFARVAPVLAALDMDKAVAFYEDKLGFAKVLKTNDPYAILKRGQVQIHLWGCTDRYIAENTSCYLYVENVAALFEEYQRKGVKIIGKLEDKPWGMKEFSIVDGDGNLLKIGEPLKK